MLSSTDVWLAAQGMVVVQGDGAVRECETILARMVGHSDTAGVESWTRVLTVVRKLQKQKAERVRVARTASIASACE